MMRRLLSTSVATLVASVALLAGLAGAQPEPWEHPDGSFHYYHAMSTPVGLNWNFAWDSALGHGGYLATITSQAENDFVFSLVDSGVYWYQRPGTGKLAGPWLGGTQDFGSQEPDSGWHWVTVESMNYRNWTPGQPDNNGNENVLHFGESAGVRVPTWDDASSLDDSIRGFVRELSADSTTLGLKVRGSGFYPGYTLFAPQTVRREFLIDDKGRPVHSWPSTYPHVGRTVLLENGLLFRGANLLNPVFSNGGRVEMVDWEGNVTWAYNYSDSTHCQHHDAIVLPNGHVLMIAFEFKTKAQALAAGRDTAKLGQNKLWPEHLVEVDPATDSIVWEWHVWDHLIQDFDSTRQNYGVVGDHPELVDLNFFLLSGVRGKADWIHANGLDYNAEYDQIILSAHNFGEAWVIDHSTTTEEAASHSGGLRGKGGDLLYRWGNPWAYRRGDSTNQQLFAQHNTQWIREGLQGAGHMMAFCNGWGRPGGQSYSTVVEWAPACDSNGDYPMPDSGKPFGPDSAYWVYQGNPPTSFYSRNGSGAQRLPNGNTLVCEQRNGRIFEVAPDTQIVWTYVNPMVDTMAYNQADTIPWDARGEDRINGIFRAYRYAPGYPGLAGKELTPDYPLERYSTRQYVGVSDSRGVVVPTQPATAWPNPFPRRTTISFGPRYGAGNAVDVFAVDGRRIRTLTLRGGSASWDGTDNTGQQVSRGIYCCRVRGSDSSRALKLIKLE
jgi:hypothetical protein